MPVKIVRKKFIEIRKEKPLDGYLKLLSWLLLELLLWSLTSLDLLLMCRLLCFGVLFWLVEVVKCFGELLWLLPLGFLSLRLVWS